MACVICGGQKYSIQARVKNVVYVRCEQCDLVYQKELPKNEVVEHLYGQENESYFVSDTKNANHITGEAWLRTTARFFIRQIEQYHDRPWDITNFLDFGCGTGILLSELQAQGATVCGVEMSPWACEYGRTHFGLTMHNEDIMTVRLAENSFDLITMSHVIEHLPNPQNIVNRVVELLKPNGLLMIATPNVDSIGARLFGERWLYYLPDEHLHLFNDRSLRQTLTNAGMNTIATEHYLWRKRSNAGAVARIGLNYIRRVFGQSFQYVGSNDGIIAFARKP
jgi:2-polyprenyl-3-methyl-5-hydroxy-6-metoxy-1,4-benzoquinol methylase